MRSDSVEYGPSASHWVAAFIFIAASLFVFKTHPIAASLCILTGSFFLLSAICRLPRIQIDRDGLTVRWLFGKKTEHWENIGRFSMIVIGQTRRGKVLRQAIAPVASHSGKKSKTFKINDGFSVSLETILQDIARFRDGKVAQQVSMPAPSAVFAEARWPWVTSVLLAWCVFGFVLEQLAAVTPGALLQPSTLTLLAMGGLQKHLLLQGEWYRLFCAPFLHASLLHLLSNSVAFVLAGYLLERFIGHAWTFCVFSFSAFAGSLMSIVFASEHSVSVGASGAIMGMLATLFIVIFRLPSGPTKMRIQTQAARIIIPALLPLAHAVGTMNIDYGAHIGGALSGVFCGGLLLMNWHRDAVRPRGQSIAIVLSGLSAIIFMLAIIAATTRYPVLKSQIDAFMANRPAHPFSVRLNP